MNANDAELAKALYRAYLSHFALRAMETLEPGTQLELKPHHFAILWLLAGTMNRGIRRALINQPPRTLKTFLISICYTAWRLMHGPTLKIAIISYDEDLAIAIARKIRKIMDAAWYQAIAPDTRISTSKATETWFETTRGGEVRALSIQGGVTGHGFDVIVIDDPMKASLAHSETERRKLEELYSSAIANRFNNPGKGVLITVMQRLHVDDFSAYLLKIARTTTHLSFPAEAQRDEEYEIGPGKTYILKKGELLEPDRLTREYLAEVRAMQGSAHYDAQYLQEPSITGLQLIKREWFPRFTEPRRHDYRVISIDPAFTEEGGCFSAALVCDFVGDDEMDIIHAERIQAAFPNVLRWVKQLDRRWKPDLLFIEAIGAGRPLVQQLKEDWVEHIADVASHQREDKDNRLRAISTRVEQGRVRLPQHGEWIEPFLREVEQFPHAPYDDWADALSQVVRYQADLIPLALRHRRRRFPEPEPDDRGSGGMRRGMHYGVWPGGRFRRFGL